MMTDSDGQVVVLTGAALRLLTALACPLQDAPNRGGMVLDSGCCNDQLGCSRPRPQRRRIFVFARHLQQHPYQPRPLPVGQLR